MFKIINLKSKVQNSKGFTLIELVVSIAIFAFMTVLVLSRYGTFNQNTLLTNMAYDMALTVKTAQTYGLSVKSADGVSNNFNSAYGVHFDMANPTQFIFFTDIDKNGYYDTGEDITKYTLTSGAKILRICLASDMSCTSGIKLGSKDILDVEYKRPNPNAILDCIGYDGAAGACPIGRNSMTQPVAFITLTSSDGSNTQMVVIRRNGQISVGN